MTLLIPNLTLVRKPLETYLIVREEDGDRELTAAECEKLYGLAQRDWDTNMAVAPRGRALLLFAVQAGRYVGKYSEQRHGWCVCGAPMSDARLTPQHRFWPVAWMKLPDVPEEYRDVHAILGQEEPIGAGEALGHGSGARRAETEFQKGDDVTTHTVDKQFTLKDRTKWQAMRNQIIILEALELISPIPMQGFLNAEARMTRALYRESCGEDMKYESYLW